MLFNASERKGVLLVLLLATAFIVVPRQFRSKGHDLFLLPIDVEIRNDSVIPLKGGQALPVHKQKATYTQKIITIELNTADSAALVKVRGIGPYYASKIIRYRERLGGYHRVSQLEELNMKYFHLDSCGAIFKADTSYILKKDLDSLDFKGILRHPYLEYEDVQLIFNAKRKYGHLSYGLLKEKKILLPGTLKKIKPYFK